MHKYYINMVADKELRAAYELEKRYIEAEIAGYWGTGEKLRQETTQMRVKAYNKIREAREEAGLPFNRIKIKQMCGLG